jgi:hypothetical protein
VHIQQTGRNEKEKHERTMEKKNHHREKKKNKRTKSKPTNIPDYNHKTCKYIPTNVPWSETAAGHTATD